MKNYYDVLGLPPESTKEDVKKAFRKLSNKFHSDKNEGDPFFDEIFKNIKEAYDILGDDSKRAQYDIQLKAELGKEAHSKTQQKQRTSYEYEMKMREERMKRKAEGVKKKKKARKMGVFDVVFWVVLVFMGGYFVVTKYIYKTPNLQEQISNVAPTDDEVESKNSTTTIKAPDGLPNVVKSNNLWQKRYHTKGFKPTYKWAAPKYPQQKVAAPITPPQDVPARDTTH
ncbi:MAG: J domain-containing protein [Bacteroidetes bacterium]|nr:J domain-containing protein [Bacteroidota bacterium]